jgi:hypothetical protein
MKTHFKLILFVLTFCTVAGNLLAQSCYPSWDYYREITYVNNSGQSLTDIQVPINVNTNDLVAQGKLNPDGSDLRFCDMSCNELHFYVDSSLSSESNVIWVKLPYVSNGTSMDILMYYGNVSISNGLANGDSTFIFFDDFENNTIDTAKWEVFGSYGLLNETDGTLLYQSTSFQSGSRWKYVKTSTSFDQRVSIDIGEYHDNNNLFGYAISDVPLSRLYQRPLSNQNDTLRMITITDTSSNGYYSANMAFPYIPVGMSQWNDLSINITPVSNGLQFNSFINHTGNNSAIGPFSISVPGILTTSAFHLCLSSITFGGNPAGLSYIKVRNGNHDIAPLSTGIEQINLFTSTHQHTLENIGIYPNPSSGIYQIQATGTIAIHNTLGVQVLTKNISGNSTIDLSGYAKGIYTLQLQTAIGTITRKLIKK